MNMRYAIKAAAAAVLMTSVAAHATESVVFVDDDPASGGSTVDAQTFYFPNAAAWTQSTFFPQTYGQGYHFSTTTGGSIRMRALLDIDESGGGADNTSGSQFQAFARWSAGNNRCNAVNIQVYNATTGAFVTQETVNQITQGRQFNWVPIGGRFTATPNQLYEIRVNSPGVCVTTADGGMFVQQTYDSSDVFNLTNNSTIDEAGIEFDTTPDSVSTGTLSINCSAPTILQSMSLNAPDTVNTSYVVCRAAGRAFHSQVNNWVFVSLDQLTGSATDTWRYTGTPSTTFPNGYDNWAMQHVYTVSSEGGSQLYYLRACRQNTGVTGTFYIDDFTCEYLPTKY